MAEDRNVQIMKSLFSKIAGSFSLGTNSPIPNHSFLVLENPGTILDPNLDMTALANQTAFSDLLDAVPYPSWMYESSSLSARSIWQRILNDKDLPTVELSAEEKAQLKTANRVLTNADGSQTAKKDSYDDCQIAYAEIVDKIQAAQIEFQLHGTPIPSSLQVRRQQSWNKWLATGHKFEIESALAVKFNLEARDPDLWWGELLNLWNSEAAKYGGNPLTFTNPDRSTWAASGPWQEVKFSSSDIDTIQESTFTRTGGSAGFGWGLWHVGGNAGYSRTEGFSKSEISTFDLSFEVRRVKIERPWMDSFVFRSRCWRLMNNSAGLQISDGADAAAGNTATGLMPLLPVGLLLAKNVKINANWSQEEKTTLSTHFTGGASFGWGPFSIGGTYEKDVNKAHTHGSLAGDTLSYDGMQILGWICDVLPVCPHPDPSLPWNPPLSIANLPEFNPHYIAALANGNLGVLMKEPIGVV